MKKTVKMIGMACLLGAFAFLGSSCKKNNNDTTSIKVGMPVVTVTDNDDAKAYIDYNEGNQMKWSKDDELMFYNLNSDYTKSIRHIYTLISGDDEPVAIFSGGVMGEAQISPEESYFAFYPASKVQNHPIGPRNSQTFDVPGSQTFNASGVMDPTSLVLAVNGKAPTEDFTLQHIFGFANFRLKGTKSVDKIVITDNKFNLNGNITIEIPGVNSTQLNNSVEELADYGCNYEDSWGRIATLLQTMNYTSDPGDKTMTLECGGVQLDPNDYTNFIITLRPGALHQGFKVEIYYTGETEPQVINKYYYQHDGYAFSDRPAYPRIFCVKPGNLRNYNVN